MRCLQDSVSVRKTAKRLNIDASTAFRWRHRFLSIPTRRKPETIEGIIEADETFFLDSYKGQRTISHRSARKRGGAGNRKYRTDKVPVLIIRGRQGAVYESVLERLSAATIHSHLEKVIDEQAVLCTDGASFYSTFTKAKNISHYRLIEHEKRRTIGKAFHIQSVNAYISRLKTWLKNFRGVATKYLENYLGWRRLLETKDLPETLWLTRAAGINNT